MQRGQLQAQAEPEEQNEVGLTALHPALLGTQSLTICNSEV